jgi:hypothetical protein
MVPFMQNVYLYYLYSPDAEGTMWTCARWVSTLSLELYDTLHRSLEANAAINALRKSTTIRHYTTLPSYPKPCDMYSLNSKC